MKVGKDVLGHLTNYLHEEFIGSGRSEAPQPPPSGLTSFTITLLFKVSRLAIVSLAALFALHIYMHSPRDSDSARTLSEAAPIPHSPAAQTGVVESEALRIWQAGLEPVWKGRRNLAIGYGQGLDWRWHELALSEIRAADDGKMYLYGLSNRYDEPRHFRVDKITHLRTGNGGQRPLPPDPDGQRGVIFTMLGADPL